MFSLLQKHSARKAVIQKGPLPLSDQEYSIKIPSQKPVCMIYWKKLKEYFEEYFFLPFGGEKSEEKLTLYVNLCYHLHWSHENRIWLTIQYIYILIVQHPKCQDYLITRLNFENIFLESHLFLKSLLFFSDISWAEMN